MTPKSGVKGSPSGDWVLSAETLLTRLHELSEDLMLSPSQAAIILQVDPDWLRKQRQTQSNATSDEDEKPLPFGKLGKGKNAAVRYRLGDLRQHIASQRVINTHGGKVCAFSSFADFMSRARLEDYWLFALPSENPRPLDFFEALRVGASFEESSWLTMGQYLDGLKSGMRKMHADDLASTTAEGSGTSPTSKRL